METREGDSTVTLCDTNEIKVSNILKNTPNIINKNKDYNCYFSVCVEDIFGQSYYLGSSETSNFIVDFTEVPDLETGTLNITAYSHGYKIANGLILPNEQIEFSFSGRVNDKNGVEDISKVYIEY